MNVLLIQPPEPSPPVEPRHPSPGQAHLFSAPWDLLCLRAYILERTRHQCHLLDTRLYSDLEKELVAAVQAIPAAQLAVVNTTSLGLGQSAAVLEILKRRFPAMRTALSGQHPSQFPEWATITPRTDYALAGDPEPILRNLLDYFDVEQRVRRIPGLITPDNRSVQPYWLPDLKGLSLPDWDGVLWSSYRVGSSTTVCRSVAELTRGNSRCPADRASGGSYEPLRTWPVDRFAVAMQKCPQRGITEVFFSDPPGVWTPEFLQKWCATLIRARNIQPWSLQLLPTTLSENTVNSMNEALCDRVEFLIPSCDPEVLQRYGIILPPRLLAHTIEFLEFSGIRVHVRFWIGGPEEHRGETERVVRMVRALNFCSFSLHPFPFNLDSPIYQNLFEAATTHVDDWIRWSQDPWILERPVALWGGKAAAEYIEAKFDEIERRVEHHPWHMFMSFFRRLASRNWIEAIENRTLGLVNRTVPPPDE